MIKTNALYHNNDPKSSHPKSSRGMKWATLHSPIWHGRELLFFEGMGVVVIPSDPNALLERLHLLVASKEVGHTGVGNELVSICDKL